MIKLWQTGQPDWIAASTREEAAVLMKSLYDLTDEQVKEYEEDLEEVPDKKLDVLIFHDDDGSTRTFREEMNRVIAAGEKFPCMFASSDF